MSESPSGIIYQYYNTCHYVHTSLGTFIINLFSFAGKTPVIHVSAHVFFFYDRPTDCSRSMQISTRKNVNRQTIATHHGGYHSSFDCWWRKAKRTVCQDTEW